MDQKNLLDSLGHKTLRAARTLHNFPDYKFKGTVLHVENICRIFVGLF